MSDKTNLCDCCQQNAAKVRKVGKRTKQVIYLCYRCQNIDTDSIVEKMKGRTGKEA
jgi:hypothetical protein